MSMKLWFDRSYFFYPRVILFQSWNLIWHYSSLQTLVKKAWIWVPFPYPCNSKILTNKLSLWLICSQNLLEIALVTSGLLRLLTTFESVVSTIFKYATKFSMLNSIIPNVCKFQFFNLIFRVFNFSFTTKALLP